MPQGDHRGHRRPRAPVRSGMPAGVRPPRHHGPPSPTAAADDFCPYQGLAPFDAEGADFFFGRARATRGVLERLGPRLTERGTILLVSGASGVGKSSLLRAGLIPALAKGMLPAVASQPSPVLLVTPTAHPLRALAEGWAEALGGDRETVHERLRDDPWEALSGDLPPDGRPVLVIDQFEELFTLVTDERERQAYVGALHALAEGPARAGVIIGVRADYWDRCAAYPQFAEAIQDGQVIVEPMTEEDLRLAITGPAAAVGLEIESGLVETILGELRADRAAGERYEAGALPLLSQALRNIWERRENGRLTVRGYEESGRIRDSIRRTADEVLERLPAEDRRTALKLFRRMTLITAGGRVARRKVTLAEIHAAASADSAERRQRIEALLSAFADRRLITLYEDAVEIAHDALLSAWPALRQWLAPDLTAQAVYDGLIDDATEWADHHGDPAFLYRGARLLSVQDSRPRWERDPDSFPPPGPTVEGFVAASAREARRTVRRRRLVMAGLAVLTVFALIAAGTAVSVADEADHQRDLAVSRQMAAQSEVVGDPVTSALLAIGAWRVAPTTEARYRLLIAAASADRGTLVGGTSSITTLAFSRDGRVVVTGRADGAVRLWDTASHRQLGAPIVPPQQECFASTVRAALSPDGRTLASACVRTVRFWDVSTHQPVGGPLRDRGVVSAIAFAPDGRTLATAGFQGTVRLWDVAARRPRGGDLGRAGSGGDTNVNAVVFSPDGKRLATGSADGTARLWDTATHDQIGAPFRHAKAVDDVAFSPDGATLATAGTDGTARLWSVAAHRQIGAALTTAGGRLGKAPFHAIAFSPDGTRLVTAGGDGLTRLWNVADHQQVGSALGDNRFSLSRAVFSPDGRLVAAAGDDGVVRLWEPVAHWQIGGTVPGGSAIALSPDGRTLAIGGAGKNDPTVRLWDVATRRPVGRPLTPTDGPANAGPPYHIVFGPGGRTLTTIGPGGVRTWDVASGRQVGSTVYADKRSGVGQLSPDGRFLAVQRDDSVAFWDIAARREIGTRIRLPHSDVIVAMAISRDGTTLAAADFDRGVRLFDVATRRQIGGSVPVASSGIFASMTFSPDGRFLAIAADDDTVRLWDVAGHRLVGAALTGHTGRITTIAFSPDRKVLATGSTDHTVRLWDLQSYRQIGPPLIGHADAVTDIVYGPDGTTLTSVGDDGTARLWNVAVPADPVSTACAIAGRSLTRAEWKRYAPHETYRRTCS
ncbi:hypothetical protein GCM10023196_016730 [Actinoallomurus vinaceus]|uniref:Novel STAND NTPase 1 domain-containing protein n=1 Tax=Actinoallomurus vinaceus TaxID=1080074 RepID=A0ABP8U371_9ACTN